MKQFSKTIIKGLFVIVLFTTGSVALSTSGAKTVNTASAAVGYNQVYEYLISKGYIVNNMAPDPGSKYNWIASTTLNGKNYRTTVYCNSDQIIGNADVIM